MGKTIICDGKYVFVSDEVAAFLEADRKRQAAEERSDRRHISKSSSVLIPNKQTASKIRAEGYDFCRREGFLLAGLFGISIEQLSGPIYTLYVNGVEDVAFRNRAMAHRLRFEKLRKVLNSLPKESRELIELYYYDEHTMEQIGRMYGISKMAVSKRIKKLLAAMRGLMETWDPVFVLYFFRNLVYKPLISVLISRGNFRKRCVMRFCFLYYFQIKKINSKIRAESHDFC